MAVSYETWRRAHGFAATDAPDPNELAIRLLVEKGSISPELTQAMIGAIAPEVMKSVRESQQVDSVAPVPQEIQQILENATPAAPAPAEEELPPALQEPQEGAQ
jgi:predicted PhzF superfamily epimerase YddE/YHI9